MDSRNASFLVLLGFLVSLGALVFLVLLGVPSSPRSSSFSSTPRNTRNPRKAYAHKKANPYFSLAFLAYSNSEEGKWQYPVGFLSR